MNDRPLVGVRVDAANGPQVRMWLLQLGADPVDAEEAAASGLPVVPQHLGVRREEVAVFVRELKGVRRTCAERFDDHGSPQRWPRGSY